MNSNGHKEGEWFRLKEGRSMPVNMPVSPYLSRGGYTTIPLEPYVCAGLSGVGGFAGRGYTPEEARGDLFYIIGQPLKSEERGGAEYVFCLPPQEETA